MKIEIIEEPVQFHLHGIEGVVENEKYGEIGFRLMNEMWQVVKGANVPQPLGLSAQRQDVRWR